MMLYSASRLRNAFPFYRIVKMRQARSLVSFKNCLECGFLSQAVNGLPLNVQEQGPQERKRCTVFRNTN